LQKPLAREYFSHSANFQRWFKWTTSIPVGTDCELVRSIWINISWHR